MQFTPFYTPALEHKVRVYISGPMTGYEDYNKIAFDEAAARFRALGFAVCSPVETSAILGFDLRHEDYLRFDFERILEADFLVVLDGWETSKGATAEVLVALRIGLEVWQTDELGRHGLVKEVVVV